MTTNTIISKETHVPVYENENQLFCHDGKILLQDKKTGDLIHVPLSQEICSLFNLKLEDTADEHTETIDSDETTTDDTSKLWTTERTNFFIEIVESFNERLDRGVKRHVWEQIAKQCTDMLGVTITVKQVESKWKSLKRTYKSVLLHNNTSGKHRRHWEYFNKIHAFMHKRPEITPVATCSSTSGLQCNNNNKGTGLNATFNDNASCSIGETTNNSDLEIKTPTSSFIRKRRNRESEVSKRHTEKMSRLDRFNDLFEKMVDKM